MQEDALRIFNKKLCYRHDGQKGKVMWELVVIWDSGEKQVFKHDTEEDAEKGGRNMKMAFGNQIQWWGTRRAVG